MNCEGVHVSEVQSLRNSQPCVRQAGAAARVRVLRSVDRDDCARGSARSFQQREQLNVQLRRDAHAFGQAAPPRLVAALRGQARAAVAEAIEEGLGAEQVRRCVVAKEASRIQRQDQLAVAGRGARAVVVQRFQAGQVADQRAA